MLYGGISIQFIMSLKENSFILFYSLKVDVWLAVRDGLVMIVVVVIIGVAVIVEMVG